MAERIHCIAPRGVKRDGDTLTGALLVERPEIAMGDIAAAVIGIDHDADCAELADSSLHFVDRGLGVDMQWHDRDSLQPLAVDRAPIIEPVIVCLAESVRIVRLSDPRQKQAAGRIDNLQVDAFLRIVSEVLRWRLRALVDRAILVAVEPVARDNEIALPVALGQPLAIDGFIIDGVPVSVDDHHAVLHRAYLLSERGMPRFVLCGWSREEIKPGRRRLTVL